MNLPKTTVQDELLRDCMYKVSGMSYNGLYTGLNSHRHGSQLLLRALIIMGMSQESHNNLKVRQVNETYLKMWAEPGWLRWDGSFQHYNGRTVPQMSNE